MIPAFIATLGGGLISKGLSYIGKTLLGTGADKAIEFVKDKTGIDLSTVKDVKELDNKQIEQLKEVENNPNYQLELKKLYYENVQHERDHDLDMRKQELSQLRVVNNTYMEELKAESWMAKNWRPLFGIIGAVSYGALFFTIIVLAMSGLFTSDEKTINMTQYTLNQLYQLMGNPAVWGILLTVTGITAASRGMEKRNRVNAQRDIELAKMKQTRQEDDDSLFEKIKEFVKDYTSSKN